MSQKHAGRKKLPPKTFQIILGKNIKISEMVIAMYIIRKVYCSSTMFLLETILLRRFDARYFSQFARFVCAKLSAICFELGVELLGLAGFFVWNFCGDIRAVLQLAIVNISRKFASLTQIFAYIFEIPFRS